MFCKNCGKQLEDTAKFCPSCGSPTDTAEKGAAETALRAEAQPEGTRTMQAQAPASQQKGDGQRVIYVKYTGFWSTGRLIIGLLSMVAFFVIVFQSCAAGIGNIFMENESYSGTMGLFCSICIFLGGVIGAVTRNSLSKAGPIAAGIFYWLGALCTVGGTGIYLDLPIWGAASAVCGFVFLFCAIKTTGEMVQK